MTKMRTIAGIVLFVLLANLCMAQDENPLGLVNDKPVDGPFVKTDRGYMVPYEAVIPGTDVKYKMIPVPGGIATVGSPKSEANRGENEGPQFEVEIKPFWIGQYEVTWSE